MSFGNYDKNEMAALRKAAIEKKKFEGKDLKQDWADEQVWLRMFAYFGFQKPLYYLCPTASNCRKYLKKLGLEVSSYKEWTQVETMSEFQKLNPKCPLWAWVGQICEQRLIELSEYETFFGYEPHKPSQQVSN
jgi:hypothetical protein